MSGSELMGSYKQKSNKEKQPQHSDPSGFFLPEWLADVHVEHVAVLQLSVSCPFQCWLCSITINSFEIQGVT